MSHVKKKRVAQQTLKHYSYMSRQKDKSHSVSHNTWIPGDSLSYIRQWWN